MKRYGLPMPRLNVKLGGREVDAIFEAEKVIVELDCHAYHSDPISFRNDRRRDRASAAAGYLTLRYTAYDLTAAEGNRLSQILRSRRPA